MTAATNHNPVSLGAALAQIAREKPNEWAVDCEGDLLSWSDLHLRSNRMARGLAKAGVKFGDYVTIALPNDFAIYEVCYGCWKIGAVPQIVSYRLPPAELNAIADLANTPLIVSNVIKEADRKIFAPAELLTLSDDESDLPDCVSPSWKASTSGGSTGRPKLIVSTQQGIVETSAAGSWHICEEKDVFMVPAPLYHNAPFVAAFNALQAGCPVVMLRKFDAEKTLSEMERRRVTLIYMVPTMMGRIWRLPEEVRNRYDISSLRTLWHVSAPCPAWLKEEWIRWIGGEKIWEKYGSAEALAATRLDGNEWLRHRGSVGRIYFGEIKVVTPEGKDAKPDEVGEVYMRRPDGASPSYRYVGSKAQSLEGGWECVGDIGWFDSDGYLYLADRRTDMILVGGAHVYPAEVEAALEEHPLVLSSAVIGLPDDDMGNSVHAIIQADPNLRIEDLKAHLADRLVSYKRPRSFERVSAPLRGDDGKVRRPALRAERLAMGATAKSFT